MLLRQHGRANDRELKRYEQSGAAFAEILPPVRSGEVAVAGAVRIPVTIDFYIDRYYDIETFKRGPGVLAISKFSDPPAKQDLAKLTLEDKAVDALRACRPGKCSLKLSAEMMNRMQASEATSGREGLDGEFRDLLLRYLASYMKKGTPAMITYSDTDPRFKPQLNFWEY